MQPSLPAFTPSPSLTSQLSGSRGRVSTAREVRQQQGVLLGAQEMLQARASPMPCHSRLSGLCLGASEADGHALDSMPRRHLLLSCCWRLHRTFKLSGWRMNVLLMRTAWDEDGG